MLKVQKRWSLSGIVQTNSEPNPNNSKPYPVWKMGQIPSAHTLTKNSKPYPAWKVGQIPSASHSQTIPNAIQFGESVRFQVPHTHKQFQTQSILETGWDSKEATLADISSLGNWVRFQVHYTDNQSYMTNKVWPRGLKTQTWLPHFWKSTNCLPRNVELVWRRIVICNSSSSSIIHNVGFGSGWTNGVIVWSIDPTTQNWSETGHGP